MGELTGISWTDRTFNPWIGCERVSPACAHCYADVLASGRMGMPGLWGGAETPRRVTSDSTWAKPLKWNRDAEREGTRLRVFCASMADVFEERDDLEVPRRRLFDLIEQTPFLDWQLLTKRPEFARVWLRRFYYFDRHDDPRAWTSREGSNWGVLPNVWVGVSVENQRWTWRVDELRGIPSVVRFISAEPLLGSMFDDSRPALNRDPLDLTGIDWLIVGGESGARKVARPMHPEWARELRDVAVDRGIAFHFKQWGSWEPDLIGDPKGAFVLPDGSRVDGIALDALGIESAWRMRYAGATPKSGGKRLDGEEWCEMPEPLVIA